MKRIFLPLIILAVVALVVVTAIVYLNKSGGTTKTNTAATTNTDTAVANTNVRTIVNRSEEGDQAVNKSITYRDLSFEVITAATLDAFHSQTAPDGKEYVVLFVKPLGTDAASVSTWLLNEASLQTAAGTTYSVKEGEMAGPASPQDSGYLWFVVDDGASQFSLVFKGDESEAKIDLGF